MQNIQFQGLPLMQDDSNQPTIGIPQEGRLYSTLEKTFGCQLSPEKVKFHLESGVQPTDKSLKNPRKPKANLKLPERQINFSSEDILNLAVHDSIYFNRILEKGVRPNAATIDEALEVQNYDVLNKIFKMGVLPTEEHLLQHLSSQRYPSLEILKLLTSIIKPNTQALNTAIENRLEFNHIIFLVKKGAIVTDETLASMKALISSYRSLNGYELGQLEEFTAAAISGNCNLGVHIYDDELQLWGEKYLVSSEIINQLRNKMQ